MYATAVISQSALVHNLSVVKAHAKSAKIVCVVKADGYGHQLGLISPLIEGADVLAVSEITQAAKLRQKTKRPILLLSGIYSEHDLQQAVMLDCQIVVHHRSQIRLILDTQRKINVWIKIDTGMHRLGLSGKEYVACLAQFNVNPNINIISIMSHFACADEPSHPLNKKQLAYFKRLTNATTARSMANSAAILSQPESLFEFVRPGIMLYGASPFVETHNLQPAMQLSAPILSIKTVQKGAQVGYGAIWKADKKTVLAIIGIGYGDGYPRHAKSGTPVMINNALCPLVGRVSMDFICVDISKIKASIGDRAIVWGDKKLPVETIAKYSDTISYELLTGVSSRVKFTTTA